MFCDNPYEKRIWIPLNPLDCKEIKPINPKGNQSWIFTGRTDAEAPIVWPRDTKNWLTGKDLDAEKDWRQEEKGTTEDEMVGWHHQLSGQELEQAPGIGEGQGSLVCCSPWGRKESYTTEQLNWTEVYFCILYFVYWGKKANFPIFKSPREIKWQ